MENVQCSRESPRALLGGWDVMGDPFSLRVEEGEVHLKEVKFRVRSER